MSASSATPSGTLRTVLSGLRLLAPGERRVAVLLAVATAAVEAVQLVGMLLVVPVVSLLIEQSALTGSRRIAELAAWLGNPPFETFVLILSGAALLFIACGLLGSFATLAATEVFTARWQVRLSRDVLAECVEAPYPWFIERHAAALARIFQQDFAFWGREFVGNLLRVFSNAVTILGGVGLVVAVAPGRGILALAAVGLVAWLFLRLVRPRLAYWTAEKRRAAERSIVAHTELLSGIKDVIASAAASHFVRLCAKRFSEQSRASARGVIYGAVPASALLLIAQTSLLLILLALWFGGSRGGELAAQMTLVMLVVSRVVPAVSRLSGIATGVVNAMPWVAGILELRSSIAAARRGVEMRGTRVLPAAWSRVRFDDVSFAYKPGARPALDRLSVELRRSGCYGLMGLSGAGKTTFIDLLLGLLQPGAGRILVDDVPLSEIDPARWRTRVGYVSQAPYFLEGTLRANIAFGSPDDEERLRVCVAIAGLEEFVAGLPQGLDTVLADRALNVSGGQRQRIAIARALYRRPEILVLDEATAALDTTTERFIVDTLARLKSDMLILIVSHRKSTVTICDEVFELVGGRLAPSKAIPALGRTAAS